MGYSCFNHLSRRTALLGLAAVSVPVPASAFGPPKSLAATQSEETKHPKLEDFGTLARVIDGDSCVLSSGLKVKLAGLMAPEKADPFFTQSKRALDALLSGRNIGLYYSGRKRDRYDRALAQIFTVRPDGTPDQWIQHEMVRLGYGRVRSHADTAWRIQTLLEQEDKSREAGRGLWQAKEFAIRSPSPNELAQDVDSFQIIEGLIISTAQVRGQTYLNFGSDYRTDFTVSIARKHRRDFEKAGVDLVGLEGARVRVRGWVELYNGPVIWLDHPQALEELRVSVS